MNARLFVRSRWLRLVLEILLWEAVMLGLAYLYYRHLSARQPRLRYGDVLFLVGVLDLLVASLGMMGRPYEVSNSPQGVWASPVHGTEEERRIHMLDEFIEKRWFATHLIATGLLTILISVMFTYWIH